jgi:hypothetical protein
MNLASSSKKGLGISDISSVLGNEESVEKRADSDDCELEDTGESSGTDIGDQEEDVFLIDTGHDSDVGDGVL